VVSPGTKTVTPKESFIVPMGNTEFIGCGAYRREGANAMRSSKPRSAAWDLQAEQAMAPSVG